MAFPGAFTALSEPLFGSQLKGVKTVDKSCETIKRISLDQQDFDYMAKKSTSHAEIFKTAKKPKHAKWLCTK